MAPVENMIAGEKSSHRKDSEARSSCSSANMDSGRSGCSESLAESLGRLNLDIEISTEPCEKASSMNKTLQNLMNGIHRMTLGSELPGRLDKDSNKKKEVKPEKIKTELNADRKFKFETCNEVDRNADDEDDAVPLGQLVARGPDRNRFRDVHHHPYWQSSSSSSSPESIVDPSSPEGSPQSIVSDHRRQSGGSITLCRQTPGKFVDPPQPPPVIEQGQNRHHTYIHKSGGGAVQVQPTAVIPIPNNETFIGTSSSTSPNYAVPSPTNAFSPSHSPFSNMVPSPSQTSLSIAGSPSMYRDVPCQSSPESYSACSPAQESILSPFPNSPTPQNWKFGESTQLLGQMDDTCFISETTGALPDDDLPTDVEELITESTGNQIASPEMIEKSITNIINLQDLNGAVVQLQANEPFEPQLTPTALAQNILSTSIPLSSSLTSRVAPTLTSTINITRSNIVSNNHPVLSRILQHSPPHQSQIPVTIVLTKPAEMWIPATVNAGAQIVPMSPQCLSGPVAAPATTSVRPKVRKNSGKAAKTQELLTIVPRPILPKPAASSVSCPSVAGPANSIGDATHHVTKGATREEVHSKLLEKFDDATRRKMNQAIQSLSEEVIFKKDVNHGDTMAHIAIAKKQILMSVNLIDRYAQKSPEKLNITNHLGQTLLLCAALTRQDDLVEYLLLSGADANQLVCSSGSSVLHYLSERGASFVSVLEKVCSFPDVSLNKHNIEGRTPLLCAVESHGKEVCIPTAQLGVESTTVFTIDAFPTIRTLLRHNASLDIPCRCAGKTALHMAVLKKKFALAQLLCSEYGRIREAINCQAYDGNTCLHYAAGMSEWAVEDQLLMVKLLLKFGASTTETNNESKVPADLVDKDRKEVKKLLKLPSNRRGSST